MAKHKARTMQANVESIQALVERRRQQRLSFTRPVQFRDLLKSESLFYGSLARDLSAGGLRIRNYIPMAKGDRLVLLLSLPGSNRVVRAVAHVTWQSQRSFGSGYETGLQFIEISPEDRDSIAGFVERGVVVS